MHNRESDIVAFAAKWRFWGGGSAEDIFVEFGLTASEYYLRLDGILDSGRIDIPEYLAAELKSLCDARLGVSESGARRRI